MKKITLEEYEKAHQIIVGYYAQDFIKVHGNDRPCICCDNKLDLMYPQDKSGIYKYGIVENISAGYGSNHDGKMYIIAVCDNCIDRLSKENKIEFAGNNTFPF